MPRARPEAKQGGGPHGHERSEHHERRQIVPVQRAEIVLRQIEVEHRSETRAHEECE